ncbi:uncharacterized protein LOC117172463 [Belonocnema kinseyi]|uniref:uncharacterized protein LOC117172463 n=1 Tax=Belonocnema kinseyi TaxID=2817044 RepID=UPI00143D7E55|nr:uncharacterized protein LOC117172463 [Belonocnema kinseyi]
MAFLEGLLAEILLNRRGDFLYKDFIDEKEEFWKESQNDNSNFFFPNACQICGCMGSEKHLLRCSKCQMISYCGKDHQVEHWPSHKAFCKALMETRRRNDVLKDAKGRKQETWVNAKLGLINLVTKKLLRKLTPHEEKVIKFPRSCLICHDVDQYKLVNCPKCPSASFCQQHNNLREKVHDEKCPEFKLCHSIALEKLRADLEAKKNSDKEKEESKKKDSKKSNSKKKSDRKKNSESEEELEEYLDPDTVISVIKEPPIKSIPYFEKSPDSMNSFLKMYFPRESTDNMSTMQRLEIADLFVKPLSAFRTLEKLDRAQERELIIHVIGAKVEDLDTYLFWETLFHWMPKVTSLKVVLFGAEFVRQNLSPKLCENCVENERHIVFELYNLGYKEFAQEKSFSKPSLVIGFQIQGKKEVESLRSVTNFVAPFAFTSDVEKLAKEEHKHMKKLLGKSVEYEAFEKNPFSGGTPSLNFETDGISYKHQFLTIYKDLRRSAKGNRKQNGF